MAAPPRTRDTWLARRRATGAASAIYGTIVVTAVIVALSEDQAAGPGELIAAAAATTVVFWLAHVYAEAVGDRASRPRGHARRVRTLLADEWPMVESAVLPIAALTLAQIDVLGRDAAVTVALALAVVELGAWGYVAGRRAGTGLVGGLAAALVNCALGGAVVLLKAVVH